MSRKFDPEIHLLPVALDDGAMNGTITMADLGFAPTSLSDVSVTLLWPDKSYTHGDRPGRCDLPVPPIHSRGDSSLESRSCVS